MKFRTVRRTITAIAIIGIGIFGISQKRTYTNILSDPNALNSFKAAEFPEKLIDIASEQLLQTVPESSIIIRATATGEKDYLFYANQQTVAVQQVYQGEGIQAGDEIHVASERWRFIFNSIPEGDLAEMAFVNQMEKGKDYLIFLDKKIDVLKKEDGRDVYHLAESLISPVFGYENKENAIVEIPENVSTYVDYSQVSNNEFFVTTQATLDRMMDIKSQLLARYPK